MARIPKIHSGLVAKAQAVIETSNDLHEFKAAQAVILPAIAKTTLEQTATILGVSRATVGRLQQTFRKMKGSVSYSRNWGGRRRAQMTIKEEEEFLAPWVEQAQQAQMIVVSPIRAALSQHLKKPVAASVVYRLLSRHGWRKVAPDTRHPKNDPHVIADWKKNSQNVWLPCSKSQ